MRFVLRRSVELNKKSVISVRVNEETKLNAEYIFKEMGLNTSVAVNIFLKQVIRTGGIPFEVTSNKKEVPK